jgi:hypothetical protein
MVPNFKLSNDLKFDAKPTSASTAVGGPSVGWTLCWLARRLEGTFRDHKGSCAAGTSISIRARLAATTGR